MRGRLQPYARCAASSGVLHRATAVLMPGVKQHVVQHVMHGVMQGAMHYAMQGACGVPRDASSPRAAARTRQSIAVHMAMLMCVALSIVW